MKTTSEVFCELTEPLSLKEAKIEASRCYYCYDAPCIQACPTQIDIPSFIRKIGNQNVTGAAMDILSANIMGGTCSRACPVEVLCQQACVRETSESKPVAIGMLQRFATDHYFEEYSRGETPYPFKRAPSNGLKVAVVGAGPAGLACAHELALLGYSVVVYEARPKAGGLNEYGLAPYKMVDDFAQKEVKFLLSVGGIKVYYGKHLGGDLRLEKLRSEYSAVFLGLGLGGVNQLGVKGEPSKTPSDYGVLDAVPFIARIRQAKDLKKIPVGEQVVVIGGGNTAVDIAIEMKKLGAESVTIAYRRGRPNMGATRHEQDLAQLHGVRILEWLKPKRIKSSGKGAKAKTTVEFVRTQMKAGKWMETREKVVLQANQVFKAIGQTLRELDLRPSSRSESLRIENGKLAVDENFQTSMPRVFAGGDCVGVGEDLTVTAVQQGKLAARGIHKNLSTKV